MRKLMMASAVVMLAACGSEAEESVRNGAGEAGTQGQSMPPAAAAPTPQPGATTAAGSTTSAGVGAPTTVPAGATAGATAAAKPE